MRKTYIEKGAFILEMPAGKFKTVDGVTVSFEELLQEPKFQAWEYPRRGLKKVKHWPDGKGPGADPDNLNVGHHYSCGELAKLWNWHRDTVFTLFVDYPNVIKYEHPETKKKRAYTSIRIPGRVAMKWKLEHTNGN